MYKSADQLVACRFQPLGMGFSSLFYIQYEVDMQLMYDPSWPRITLIQMDGWMDGWTDGRMYVYICVCVYMYVIGLFTYIMASY